MAKTDIQKMLEMNYSDCCDFLLKKYGKVKKDYFTDDTCSKKTPGIARGKEGLYIHHIDEDKAILLSNPKFAVQLPFDFQKSDRLVYCNLLEHLVCHIKIVQYPNPILPIFDVGTGGIYNFIFPELNDIYSGIVYRLPWKNKVAEVVRPLKEDFLLCAKTLVDMHYDKPLLTSFNANFGLWSESNNKELYKELKKIGIKK